MKRRIVRSVLVDQAPLFQCGPGVLSIIKAMEEPKSTILAWLRDMVLSLPEVEERTVYDGFCREWTPAYYVGDRQLFHVHNFRSGLRATLFVGVRTLEPAILESETVAPELRLLVARTSGHRGRKMVKVPVNSSEDVGAFMGLVSVKWKFLTTGL